MKLFDLDLEREHRSYGEQGWVHASPGVTAEFLEHLERVVDERVGGGWLQGPGLAGAKQQLLFDFPEEVDLEVELFDPVASLFGLDRDQLTMSERHLKVYDPDADPWPLPHKDRLASTVSVGITVRAPEGTRAFLHPDVERDENPFMGPHLLASLSEERHPRAALDETAAVEIRDAPGDVLAFPGSSIWHGRRQAAGAVLLYLKFNAFGADPLREDPRTGARERRTRELLDQRDPAARVTLGPDLVALSQRSVPPSWDRTTVAEVWDRSPIWLSATDEAVLRRAADGPPVADVVSEAGDDGQVWASLRRLADAGVVLLRR